MTMFIKESRKKHLTKNLAGRMDLNDEGYAALLAKFASSPETCGRDEMNEVMERNCRSFHASVHLSMLVLSSTMVKVESELVDAGQPLLFRNSNMRVNHNNPSKTASMEMINNMAFNPLKIDKKNSNDRSSWGKDMEVYMTVWDQVSAHNFRILQNSLLI